MSSLKQLGANIRSLRMAYGETQEQLGEVLFVEKNAVSYYETGKREPDKETLSRIAKYYAVSVDELLHSDLTSIKKIEVDTEAFWKNIDTIFPIISSERAMQNANFKKAFEAHKAFYSQLHFLNLDGIENVVDICYDGYMSAVEDDDIKVEAAANFIALCYLIKLSLKTPEVMKFRSAALRQVAAKDEKIRGVIENIDPSSEADAKAILDEINDGEMGKVVSEMLTTIKRSRDWSDLADYYLALQYVYNLVDNDLDWGLNQRIGVEMMSAFVSVKNIHVARFIKYITFEKKARKKWASITFEKKARKKWASMIE